MKQKASASKATAVYFTHICSMIGCTPSEIAGYLVAGYSCSAVSKLECQDFPFVPDKGWQKNASMRLRLILVNHEEVNIDLYNVSSKLEQTRKQFLSLFEHPVVTISDKAVIND